MSENQFDGPSFVNPQHTSYNLDKGISYTTPNVRIKTSLDSNETGKFPNAKSSSNKKVPRGGWEDDEVEKDERVNTKIKNNKTSGISIKDTHNNNSRNNNSNKVTQEESTYTYKYVNYWDAENTKKIQNSILSKYLPY